MDHINLRSDKIDKANRFFKEVRQIFIIWSLTEES